MTELVTPSSTLQDDGEHVLCIDIFGKSELVPLRKYAARRFVVACLHYEGAYHSVTTAAQVEECYKLADGFGPYTPELAEYFAGGYDWSHIRDSSWGAFERMAEYLSTFWVDETFDAMIAKWQEWAVKLDMPLLNVMPLGSHSGA